ncbi:MAG: hypothetical protein ABS920_13135 [Sporosarcina sp.]
MSKGISKGSAQDTAFLSQAERKANAKTGAMKEEISLELAELGNLNPKHGPMSSNNQREVSESDKTYK